MEKQDRAFCSPSLLAAQGKLETIRSAVDTFNQPFSRDEQQKRNPALTDGTPYKISDLPVHLGWGSDPLSVFIHRYQRQYRAAKLGDASLSESPILSLPSPPTRSTYWKQNKQTSSNKVVKLYPDIALAFLRNKLAAVARIWLLLKHLDSNGCGWVDDKWGRDQLSNKTSPTKVCGRRQLRKLFARGDGIFWERAGGRIWLRSLTKIADALGVYRLSAPPVALPVSVLLKSIGVVRAHFYASFHSGRIQSSDRGKPIARATLRELSAVCSKTQLHYEDRAGVKRQFNYAIGSAVAADEIHELAWKHGRALFVFTDKKGLLGAAGRAYTAWQLPNTYVGPHERQPKGRRNRINRELADLFQSGMTGNDRDLRRSDLSVVRLAGKRYFDSGSAAVTAFNRDPTDDLFWPTGQGPAKARGYPRHRKYGAQGEHCIWRVLPGGDTG